MNAFENISGDQFVLSPEVMKMGIKGSRTSKRKRIILPIHRTQDARVQRMLNFLQPGTYIRPHMHPLDHATESLVLIQGSICFYIFSPEGDVQTSKILRAGSVNSVADIQPRIWHSFTVLEEDTVLFECKLGPYNETKDKIFATWAPAENSEGVKKWLAVLRLLEAPV
jgi:cupin fold WbuC family metalloprotein